MAVVTQDPPEGRPQSGAEASQAISRADILTVLRELRDLQASEPVKASLDEALARADIVEVLTLITSVQRQVLAKHGYDSESRIAAWNEALEELRTDEEIAAVMAESRVRIDLSQDLDESPGTPVWPDEHATDEWPGGTDDDAFDEAVFDDTDFVDDDEESELVPSHCTIGCVNCDELTYGTLEELMPQVGFHSPGFPPRCANCGVPYPHAFTELISALQKVCQAMAELRTRHPVVAFLDAFSLPPPYGPTRIAPDAVDDWDPEAGTESDMER